MNDLLLHKQERHKLFGRLELLQVDLRTAKDDAEYYRQLLKKTRSRVLEIKNLVGAKSVIADLETVDEAWMRNIDEIIEKLNETS